MIIYEDGIDYTVSVPAIQSDLRGEGFELVLISRVGELVIDGPEGREVWQARPSGLPDDMAMNLSGIDFEFVRSVQ